MLAKAFDYLRIAETKPSDDTVTKRKNAAAELLSKLTDSNDPSLLAAATAVVVVGLDVDSANELQIVSAAYDAVRKHSPATPSSWREIPLDIRACIAIALGELISGMEKIKVRKSALLAAAFTLASRSARASSEDRYVELMLADLVATAQERISALAAKNRARGEMTQSVARKAPTAELLSSPELIATYIKGVLAELDGTARQLRREISLDREELDIVWWLQGRASHSFQNRAFSSLPRGDAALAAAIELERASQMPPARNSESLLSNQLSYRETSNEIKPISLKELLSELDASFRSTTLTDLADGTELAKQFPQVLPLTWVLTRIEETRGMDSWAAEALTVVGTPLSELRTPAEWSCLLFRERVALRLARDFQEA
jgi:hypothetical protein